MVFGCSEGLQPPIVRAGIGIVRFSFNVGGCVRNVFKAKTCILIVGRGIYVDMGVRDLPDVNIIVLIYNHVRKHANSVIVCVQRPSVGFVFSERRQGERSASEYPKL